ncbi:hypothetical protein EEW87_010595 [Janibacter melonis]|uniref:AtpZ/AtpI family protein n=1 Tax=Janibacter melonis TaxID=262209 RepID=A0A5P8FM55_9MICO|nr:AtpZ/AtpI family protein [Janibacter melonis]QFQ30636.1 hypothetical protein EEW87_010595 [Janibacter melonis]
MSPRPRKTDTPAPRLVTRREGVAPDAHRWSTETEGPSPTAQADALGATVLAYLVTGPVLFGGAGWLLDRWLGTSLIVAVGVVVGMGLSLYVIWLRYGTSQAPTSGGDTALPGAKPHNEENP